MKIKTKWNCGNFTLTHGSDVPEKLIPALLEVALLHVEQRDSRIDELLGIVRTVNGKKVRGKLKRIDVPYSDAIAESLTDTLTSFSIGDGDEAVTVPVTTLAERYDRETADSKFTRERAMAADMESAPDFDAKSARCFKAAGLPATTPTHGNDGEYSPEFLAAIRARVKELSQTANI